MAIKRTAQSSASGTVSAGAAAVGDRVYLFGLSDTASLTLTPPSDGQTWTEIDQGSEVGAASSTLAGWWADMVGSVPANFTVGGGTIAATALFILNPNGDTLGTPDVPTMTTSIVGGSGAITSPVLNAGAASYTICAFSADDQSTITTPPALMDEDIGAIGTGCSLALFSAADANDATFSDTLTWSTLGTERMCIGISQPFTVAGPSIGTQPTAQTARVNGDPTNTATMTCAATGTGTVDLVAEIEDGVASGVYATLANGSGATWSGLTGTGSGSASTSLVGTFTAKTLTGRRIRFKADDDNGTRYSDAVVLTIYTGPVLSTYSGTGAGTIDLSADEVLGTGYSYRVTVTPTGYASAVKRSHGRGV